MSAEFLQQLYAEVLGREPDPAGFAHNLSLLESGAISPAEMANAFAGSQEAQSNTIPAAQEQQAAQNISQQFGGGGDGAGGMNSEQILNKAYQDVFGRAPDPGAQGWLRDINAGLDLEGLKGILARTPEAREKALQGVSPIVGQNDPNNFVSNINQLYMSSLGRLPDPESLVSNLNLLNQNPDAFGWLAQSVVNSPEAQKYAEKTGIDPISVYGQVTADYGKWTPAASSPMPGGLGGLLMKTGPFLPFALAGGALAAPYLTGAGAAAGGTAAGGTAAGGTAASGLSGLYSSLPSVAQAALKGAGIGAATGGGVAGLTGGNVGQGILRGGLIGGAAGGIIDALSGLSFAKDPSMFSSDLVELAKTSGGMTEQQLIDILKINYGVDPFTAADAANLALTGNSARAIDQILGYSYSPAELAGTGITSMATSAASGLGGILNNIGNILGTPLGRLGAMGGLSLLSGGGQQQPVPIPQMAGGGTIVPRGQVDYTPIINLLAPRQISRNSLLG